MEKQAENIINERNQEIESIKLLNSFVGKIKEFCGDSYDNCDIVKKKNKNKSTKKMKISLRKLMKKSRKYSNKK